MEISLKVLHYLLGLPPVRTGGLVKYVLDLAEAEARKGYEIDFLLPGYRTKSGEVHIIERRNRLSFGNCYYVLNPALISMGRRIEKISKLADYGEFQSYVNFLQERSPYIIHIHSLMGLHISFLEAAKQLKIPVIYTTHDFFGICPKGNLLHGVETCQETDWNDCDMCMGQTVSQQKLLREQSIIYEKLKSNLLVRKLEYSPKLVPIKRFLYKKKHVCNGSGAVTKCAGQLDAANKAEYEVLREYYRKMFSLISFYHFNSEQSREIYFRYLGNVNGKAEPISNCSIRDNRRLRTYQKTLRIGYIAPLKAFKGFDILLRAMDSLYQEGMQDFICHIYYNFYGEKRPYIKIHRPYAANELEQVFEEIDVLILPSVCYETFGMVVLEALSYGVPVVVSDRVGSKDILEQRQGIGIIIEAKEDKIKEALKEIYCNRSVLKEMNQLICDWEVDFSYDRHVDRMLDLYSKVCEGEERI